MHLNRENEDRISEGFYSTLLNRSSIKMLAINQKKKKKKKIFFFFFLLFFFTNKKKWGGPYVVGAGGDENLKINFLWPYERRDGPFAADRGALLVFQDKIQGVESPYALVRFVPLGCDVSISCDLIS